MSHRRWKITHKDPEGGAFKVINSEVHAIDANTILSKSVPLFRTERGKLPLSKAMFGLPSTTFPGWKEWVEFVIQKAHYKKTLKQAAVFDGIMISSCFDIYRDEDVRV